MKILLSIKPEFVEKIFRGEKKFEYRKVVFKNKSVRTVVVYSTMPVGKIVGEFTIKTVHRDTPKKIWLRTQKYSGIEEDFYNHYFEGRKHSFAIEILNITLYEKPIDPKEIFDSFVAPQSFLYIENYDSILADKKSLCILRTDRLINLQLSN